MLPSDGRALGLLAYAACRGTIDDHGESVDEHVEELTATLGGHYGRLLVPATRVVTHANGTLVAAALFTWRDELPFLAFCLTHPHSQGRGLATGPYRTRREGARRRGRPRDPPLAARLQRPLAAARARTGHPRRSSP